MRRMVILSSSSPGLTGNQYVFHCSLSSGRKASSSSSVECRRRRLDELHDAGHFDLLRPRQLDGRLAEEGARGLIVGIHAPAARQIGPAARGVGRGIQADDRRVHHGGHVRGTGVRRQQHGGARQQREQLRQRVLADLVDERHARVFRDGRGHLAFDGGGSAAEDHAHAVCAHGVLGHRGVALRQPVARAMARTGADQQRRLCIGNQLFGVGERRGRQRNVPARRLARRRRARRRIPRSCRARARAIASAMRRLVNSHCSSRARGLSKPSLIGADMQAAAALARIDSCRCSSRSNAPRRCISVRSRLIRGETGALVHGDKLHIRNEAHQFRFEFADHPGEARARPGALQRAQQRHHVAGIADGRQPQQADFFR